MTSALLEAEDSSVIPENSRIAELESQVFNSQESLVRLNRELDSALLRITTLENVCTENQNDLHEKRTRLKRLNDELNEQEETIERLNKKLNEKDQEYENLFGNISLTDLHSQIEFDQQLRKLIFYDLDDDNDENNSSNQSPQTILYQYQNNQRLKFYNLLQECLITEDISNLIDSDDILFEILTRLNSLNRLKETLSRDSKELYHIRSLLHLTNDDNNNDQILKDLISKQQCLEYLRTKIDQNQNLNDFDLIKFILHNYFNYQQQQNELKEYLQLDQNNEEDINYSRILIQRFNETIHVQLELNQRIENQNQFIEQLQNQLNETIEQQKQIDELLSKFSNDNTDQSSQLDRIQTILQSNMNLQQTTPSKNSDISNDKQLIIDELTQEISQLKEEVNQRKDQLKDITKLLELDDDDDDEKTQLNLLRSSFESLINFRLALSNKLLISNDNETILKRIEDYQTIINEFNSEEKDWTMDQLITKLQTMKHAEDTVEDLQKRLDQSIDHEKQLQIHIKQIVNAFVPETEDNEESDLTRIHQLLQSLTNSSQNIFNRTQTNTDEDVSVLFSASEKQDIETQTIDNDKFYIQIRELLDVDEDQPKEIINKINELLEKSQVINKEYEQLRNLLNIEDKNFIESVRKLIENFHQLQEEHEKSITKENNLDKSIERIMNKIGLSSDSSTRTRIDEISTILDTLISDYCQLISTDNQNINLIEIFKHIQLFLEENNQYKQLIDQIDSDQSNYLLKLQTYLTKVKNLCQLISEDNSNIDQVLIIYQQKLEDNNYIIDEISNFKQQLLKYLSIDNEEQIFNRLDEIQRINSELNEKLQNNHDSTSVLSSLNTTISEQENKILEYEDTTSKLRSQRERMLNKMKEMKINNETLTEQVKQANQLIDEFHRKEIDYKNEIETIEQQLRSAKTQIQVTLDDCRTQQDLQETMKLEIESIQNEIETQKKLYENRCRQIINEKNQIDKNSKEILQEKQILEDENKYLQTILNSIKDTFENVDDIHSIVDMIVKLRHDHLIAKTELKENNEQIQYENEKLLSNFQQQESRLNEYIQIKLELEKRLVDTEQEILNLNREIHDNHQQYQSLQKEYDLYKENNQIKQIQIESSSSSLMETINMEPLQQTNESSNDWMTIDMKDEEIPLTINKHSITIDTPTALFNMLGELKSKLGITLTHRPRSSSVFFIYLCAVHILTIYLLFIRHC